ncbi:hypothetical protein APT12_24680 [Escherichia coli]|nr:hypothetical protein APT12_24680 [Escherichia coli]
MIWQPEFTDKTLSRKPGAVQMCQSSQLFQHQVFPRLFIISDVGSCSLSRNTLDRLATDWKVTLSILSL